MQGLYAEQECTAYRDGLGEQKPESVHGEPVTSEDEQEMR